MKTAENQTQFIIFHKIWLDFLFLWLKTATASFRTNWLLKVFAFTNQINSLSEVFYKSDLSSSPKAFSVSEVCFYNIWLFWKWTIEEKCISSLLNLYVCWLIKKWTVSNICESFNLKSRKNTLLSLSIWSSNIQPELLQTEAHRL